jgi:hypothetical protein
MLVFIGPDDFLYQFIESVLIGKPLPETPTESD